MSTLTRVQGDFQDYMLRGATAVQQHIIGSARVPVATRLAIYGGAYGSRLAEALENNFPALAKLLGETDFRTLAADYIHTHDSPFFSIRYYGDALPRFLASHEDYVAAPVLAELARWEWTLCAVFDAADAEPVGAAALTGVAPAEWAELRFEFHPSVRRLALRWNVPQLWKALTDEGERPELSVVAEPVEWLLWRRDLRTYFRSLAAGEAAALDAARAGSSFGELCELLAGTSGSERAPAEAAALLAGWLGAGLLVAAAPA